MTEGIKIVVRGTLPTRDEWRNVFYYTGSGDFTDSTITNWLNGLYGTLTTTLSSNLAIYAVDVATRLGGYVDNDPLGWGASTTINIAKTFSSSGDYLPQADCALVLATTGVKHVFGRKLIPGLTEGLTGNGIITGTVLTAFNNFGAYWKTPTADPLGSGSTSCVWGPLHGFTPIQSTRTNPNIMHLRRRQVSRGI